MFNCYELVIDGITWAICPTWARAKAIALMVSGIQNIEYTITGKYIKDVGF